MARCGSHLSASAVNAYDYLKFEPTDAIWHCFGMFSSAHKGTIGFSGKERVFREAILSNREFFLSRQKREVESIRGWRSTELRKHHVALGKPRERRAATRGTGETSGIK